MKDQEPESTKLWQAILRAQAKIQDPVKNKTNPAFKSKYADLGAVLDAVKEPLAAEGLLLMQMIQGALLRTAIICTKTGQSVSSEYPLPTEGTPQQFGSAISYAKRYSIMAMLCLQSDDDDGQAASEGGAQKTNTSSALLTNALDKLAKAKTAGEVTRIVGLTVSLAGTPAAEQIKQAADAAMKRIG